MGFQGFGAGLVDFFSDLEEHNDRGWWQANRQRHAEHVGEPMRGLAEELERTYGPVKIFRPYRDVRFSADKRPLQEHASMVTTSAGPPLYLQVSADGLLLGGGWYHPDRPQLEAFRALLDRPGSASGVHRQLDALAGQDFQLIGTALRTAPRGYRRDHPEIALLRQTGLAVRATFPPGPWLASPEVLERIHDGWRNVQGWNRWLAEHLPAPAASPTARSGASR